MANKDKKIAIAGIGPITSIGFGKKDLWNLILRVNTCLIEEESS